MTGGGAAGVSRRSVLAGMTGLAGLGVGAAAGVGIGRSDRREPEAALASQTVDFYGTHQAGIVTPPQAHANFVGLDLVDPRDPATLAGILRLWSQDGARLVQGVPGLADPEPELAPNPSRLTVTVGLGPGAFDAAPLRAKRPGWLGPLPSFAIDRLQDRWGQTDLIVHVGSDDPLTLAHATRILTAEVRTLVKTRWVQRGFRTARGTQPDSQTQRNLFGQIDGTVQPAADRYDELIWDDGADQPWLAGGTSMVVRRIAMHMDTWEALDRGGREFALGRRLGNGAPLTGTEEHDEPDFTATKNTFPVIPETSHIARAHRRADHEQFLRRSYNYDEPPEPPVDGMPADSSNIGLVFVTYQRDPVKQFVPVQQRLSDLDHLNEWTTPIGSAVYAMLPGAEPDRPLGYSLFH